MPARIRYDAGSASAPDDPIGRTLLILEPAGLVRLGNWHRGGVRAWSGTIALGVMDRVLEHLGAGGFPDSRPRSLRPGGIFKIIVETDPPQSVTDNTGTSNAGYRSATDLLDAVISQLSGDQIRFGRARDEKLVLSARPIAIDQVV